MNSNEIIISPQQRAQIEALEYIGAGACANVYKDNDTVYKIIKENAKPLYWPGSLENYLKSRVIYVSSRMKF